MEPDMSHAVKQSDVYQDLLNLPENIIGEINWDIFRERQSFNFIFSGNQH